MPRTINLLVIHCADVPNGRWTTTGDINGWHRARKFKRQSAARSAFNPALDAIGYHWVIYTDGTRATGRAPEEVGAHAAGHNADSLGICLVGTDRFTPIQWAHLAVLVRDVCTRYRIPIVPADTAAPVLRGVIGHGEIPGVAKRCPGFSVRDWLLQGMTPDPQHILLKD
ncbi:MAG: N-acetylmuramoyl-L-alanine amidase [Proteobacteria bacterium]|nr:N-acetylmuramoyl-L-alanine amidase [Pseudomonadota bacterium]